MPKIPIKDYLWVIDSLMRHPMTLADLQRSYLFSSINDDHRELQAKTFYNWRMKIEEWFNIRIEYVDDAYCIVEAGEPERKAALEWLVQSLSVNTALNNSRELSGRILLEDIPSGEVYLRQIIEAMKESRQLKMSYARFDTHIGDELTVEPFCVKVNNRRWYMLARVTGESRHNDDYPELDRYGCLRIYALDRILTLENLDTTFVYPEDFDPDELFRNHFGVCIAYGVPLERVKVWIARDYRDYIETLPLHHSQTLIEESDDDDGIYEYYLHPTIDFFRALMSLGADAEVLEPEWFRLCFQREADLLSDIYNDRVLYGKQ